MGDANAGITATEKKLIGISILGLYVLFGLLIAGVLPVRTRSVQRQGGETVDLNIITASATGGGTVCKVNQDPLPVMPGDLLRVNSNDGDTYTVTFTGENPLVYSPSSVTSGSVNTIKSGLPYGTTFPYTISGARGCKTTQALIGIKIGH